MHNQGICYSFTKMAEIMSDLNHISVTLSVPPKILLHSSEFMLNLLFSAMTRVDLHLRGNGWEQDVRVCLITPETVLTRTTPYE